MRIRRFVLALVSAIALVAGAEEDQSAWKYEGTTTTNVTAAASKDAPALTSTPTTGAAGSEGTVTSILGCTLLQTGFTYNYWGLWLFIK